MDSISQMEKLFVNKALLDAVVKESGMNLLQRPFLSLLCHLPLGSLADLKHRGFD